MFIRKKKLLKEIDAIIEDAYYHIDYWKSNSVNEEDKKFRIHMNEQTISALIEVKNVINNEKRYKRKLYSRKN